MKNPNNSAQDTSSQKHNAEKMRVLVVDDNEASAKTMGWTMELLGSEFRVAYNGTEAISTAAEFKPDLILLDISLPGMNGYDVCRELKKMPELSKTIIAAQTGWGQEEHRILSKEAGFDHHLVKPIDMPTLQDLLASVNQPQA